MRSPDHDRATRADRCPNELSKRASIDQATTGLPGDGLTQLAERGKESLWLPAESAGSRVGAISVLINSRGDPVHSAFVREVRQTDWLGDESVGGIRIDVESDFVSGRVPSRRHE
jgi:hypothetical protein